MLESIYKNRYNVGPEQSPLGAYLSSQAGKPKTRQGRPFVDDSFSPLQAAMPQVAKDGSFSNSLDGGNVPSGVENSYGFAPGGNPQAIRAQQQAQTGGMGPDMAHLNFDYSSDPALLKMLAGGAVDETDADAQALSARRGVLGQYGDRQLAEATLGKDDPTLGAISDNPDTSTSTLARLKRAYGTTVQQNEDAINENNLWYGGKHAQRLGDLAKDYSTQQGDASSQVQAALDQIGGALSAQKAGIRDKTAAAESDAAARRAQQLLAEIMLGGFGGNGATPDTGTGAADTGATNAAGFAPNTSYADLGLQPGPTIGPNPTAIGGSMIDPMQKLKTGITKPKLRLPR